ncbi:MAG: bifunctional oligoribonuclease/PAP phosphatase NrnA [Candidatus Omnitrophota bacterium]
MSLAKIKEALEKYNKFLIVAHKKPEGDAIGSMMGMYLLLKKLNKEAVMANADVFPDNLDCIKFAEIKQLNEINKFGYEAVIVLDCADENRTGSIKSLLKGKPVINIDHHISNTKFADINWIDGQTSSVAEMLYHLFKKMQVPFDIKSALSLYVGIMTDTGSFKFSNTSPQTLKICAELLEFGIKSEEVYNSIYNRRSVEVMRLLGLSLADLKTDKSRRICWISVTPQILKKTGVKISECDDFIDFVKMVKTAEVAAIFYYLNKDKTKISLRSKGKIDVNEIAFFFGGGGHKLASGAEINASLEKSEKMVIERIEEEINKELL